MMDLKEVYDLFVTLSEPAACSLRSLSETDFFHEDRSFRFSAKPKAGRASLFDSQQYHCGQRSNPLGE